jgi:hypothetical protein
MAIVRPRNVVARAYCDFLAADVRAEFSKGKLPGNDAGQKKKLQERSHVGMNALLLPERPVIYLGQPFTLQLTLLDGDEPGQWVSTQIVGRTRTLNPAAHRFLWPFAGDATVFDHVQSDSQRIASDVSGRRSFSLTIVADRIPPSYDGSGVSITYELLIACQTGGSVAFPVLFVAPRSHPFSLATAQRDAVLEIQTSEVELLPGRLSVRCPVRALADRRDVVVQRTGGIVAMVRMPSATAVGHPIVGVISLDKTDSGVTEVTASLFRRETIGTGDISRIQLCSRKLELNGALARRFSIPVPFTTVADFETEIVKITHFLEFTFYGTAGAWKWTSTVSMFPPEISPTKPRVSGADLPRKRSMETTED